MQTALSYRTNRDLFSNYYLDEHLPETEEWDEISEDELSEAYEEINELWEREKNTAPKRNESQLEEKFIRPMFRKLGIPFEVEESTSRTQRRPDYGFFESEQAARGAFERREEGGDFYENTVAVADAKRWGRPLDTRGSGEHERDFENPSYQIHVYLQETDARWAVLTDGQKWRLYYGPTSHRLDSYYEIDLPTVLEKGDIEDFKYFYLFFRHEAFLKDASGDSFLDDVYGESNVFAQELGEDLQDNIYDAIKVLSEGFLQYPENDLNEDDLDRIHDSSLIYLYRLIFVLYAESEGRDLLNTDNEIYEQSYSLNSLKQEIAEELDSADPKYRNWQDNLWSRLEELFKLIDQGSKSRGIPEEDLYIPAYNGGLFRTNPDANDSQEARFLANHEVGDAYLARVIELLTRSQSEGGKIFVDYSSLDVRHLGSIYEGLLEYQLNVADEPLALDDGEYVIPDEDDEIIVEAGEVYLTTGSGERKATGSYYTPEYVVEYIVDNTLEPLVDDIREDLVGQSARGDERGFAEQFANRVFDLKVLDPAMGSGHFLTNAVDYLAREIIDAQEKQAAQQGIETVDEDHDINWARRQVAQRCIYGVDLNPLAVELAKVSLWLRTLAAEQPLAFLDHHLKTGNSLVGSDIEEIEELESEGGGDEQNASLADFGVARKGTIEQLMRIYEDFIAIENQELADVKEMESKYDEFERNKLRQRLESMANVQVAKRVGLSNVPLDAQKRMAAALEDDQKWSDLAASQWFQDSQRWGDKARYFHWKLEYPEVFYNQDGSPKNEPGFDAIVGNPPYVDFKTLPQSQKDLIEPLHSTCNGKFDVYIPFMEDAIRLSRRMVSFIVPSMFMKRDYGRDLRQYLVNNTSLRTLLDFQHLQIFGDATNFTCTVIFDRQSSNTAYYKKLSKDKQLADLLEYSEPDYSEILTDVLTADPWQFLTENQVQALGKLREQSVSLEDVTAGIRQGLVTSKDSVFLLSEDEVSERNLETELWRPLARGEDVSRWSMDSPETRVFYPYTVEDQLIPEERLDNDFPNTYDYLLKKRDELKGRSYYEDVNKEWYELWRPRETSVFSDDKILVQEISDKNVFCFDSEGYYFNTKAFGIHPKEIDMKYLLGLLNSSLLEFDLKTRSVPKRGGYYEYNTQFLKKLSIVESPEEDIKEQIVTEVEAAVQASTTYRQLNLNLFDYIATSSSSFDGQELSELYTPSEGLATSTLVEDESTREGLRIQSGNVVKKPGKLQLQVTVRYKPGDPENHDIDRWGYTGSEPLAAMDFISVSPEEEALITEFVPYAIEEASGFANFRRNATQTKTLIDRLEQLTLPETDRTQADLQRYIDVKKEASDLKTEVKEAEVELDELVYELYDITKEEQETIESWLSNDRL
ncbi:class I SAM-dependent DNA methyltransferase [Halalkalicoccus subterraneus]|uniref:class I SAM-dependent DNA methyltransferase n=1 Tax=Halalkalicoccus subterraneus TaxID=2675002 RepID=UPI000EFA8E70|nr:class I SAM-dependent DNA methyltransferase [Halalkalicoccus subterraneus]